MTTSSSTLDERAERLLLAHLQANGPGGLEDLCSEHPELAERLRDLHAAFEAGRRALVRPDEPPLPEHIGGYRVLRKIGAGGMGVVYKVWDQCLQRELALKTARGGRAMRATEVWVRRQERLRNEARTLASIVHPAVVPLHSVGEAQGVVFFTMQFVEGRHLGTLIGPGPHEAEWTLARLAGVLHRVCEAVAHAHRKGIVHRDLKPANVMVGPFGETYVMDWGLAKRVSQPTAPPAATASAAARGEPCTVPETGNAESTPAVLTMAGEVIGTPAYMAPEQAFGRVSGADPRTDVYSAGTILYHLLAGGAPYSAQTTTQVTPKTTVDQVRSGPPEPLRKAAPGAPFELIAIAEKAMARDPNARYPDMRALADDLRAWLEGRVVGAHRTGVLAEVRKWVLRNRMLAAASLLVLASLVAGAALQYHAASELAASARQTRWQLYASDVGLAASALQNGDLKGARRHLRSCPEELRGWEWRALARNSDTRTDVLRPTTDMAFAVASPDGRYLLWGDHTEQRCEIWDVAQRALVCAFPSPEDYLSAHAFDVERDELYLGGRDGWLRVHGLQSGAVLRERQLSSGWNPWLNAIALSPNRQQLAVSLHNGELALVDPRSLRRRRTLGKRVGPGTAVQWSSDGERLYWGGGDSWANGTRSSAVRVYHVASGRLTEELAGHQNWVQALSLHPDETLLASGDHDGKVIVWDLQGSQPPRVLPQAVGETQVAWSRDGRSLLVSSLPQSTRVLDVTSWKVVEVLAGTPPGNMRLFSLPERRVVETHSRAASFWTLDDPRQRVETQMEAREYFGVAIRPSAAEFALTNAGHLEIWGLEERRKLRSTPREGDAIAAIYTPDGHNLLVAPVEGQLEVRDAESLELSVLLDTDHVRHLTMHPTLPHCATGDYDGTVELWDVQTNQRRWAVPTGTTRWPFGVTTAFSPDGAWLVAGTTDGRLCWIDVETGELVREVTLDSEGFLGAPAIAPHGRDLAVRFGLRFGSELLCLDFESGRVRWRHAGATRDEYRSPKFSVDGSRVFAAGRRGRLAIFDGASGQPLPPLAAGSGIARFLAVSRQDHVIIGTVDPEEPRTKMLLHFWYGGPSSPGEWFGELSPQKRRQPNRDR